MVDAVKSRALSEAINQLVAHMNEALKMERESSAYRTTFTFYEGQIKSKLNELELIDPVSALAWQHQLGI